MHTEVASGPIPTAKEIRMRNRRHEILWWIGDELRRRVIVDRGVRHVVWTKALNLLVKPCRRHAISSEATLLQYYSILFVGTTQNKYFRIINKCTICYRVNTNISEKSEKPANGKKATNGKDKSPKKGSVAELASSTLKGFSKMWMVQARPESGSKEMRQKRPSPTLFPHLYVLPIWAEINALVVDFPPS